MPSASSQVKLSCSAFIATICTMLLLVSSSTKAAPFQQIEDPQGMVWFIGTVEQITDGIPAIDLGEVHTLRTPGEARPFAVELGGAGAKRVEELPPGCRVVVVRNRNNRFSPLGLMNVHFTHPTWSEMEKPTSFSPEVGDIVMFVGAPGELGSGATIRDSFIRHRIVANSNRNRYSTMRESIKANALQGIIEKQPTWVKGQRRIAGVIRSVSVTKDSYVRLKPFINQIMMFQDYQDQGVHVSQVTTGAWQGVLDELRYKKDAFESSPKESAEAEAGEAGPAIATENKVNPDMLVAVQRVVNEAMFERFLEERDVIAVVCATLLQTKTSNERQWMGQQLTKSQFPELGNQEQVLIDMEGVMRIVRKSDQ
jgi:hypothetical protein